MFRKETTVVKTFAQAKGNKAFTFCQSFDSLFHKKNTYKKFKKR